MTTAEAQEILKCPHCGALAKLIANIVEQTDDSVWTDGKLEHQCPSLTRCKSCKHFYWISEADEVGVFIGYLADINPDQFPKEWNDAQVIEELNEKDLLDAVKDPDVIKGTNGLVRKIKSFIFKKADNVYELNLRVLAWWAGNDQVRGKRAEKFERTPQARNNLKKLFALLDSNDPNQRLMKAEVARELGKFKESLRLLDCKYPGSHETAKKILKRLVEKKDSIVRPLNV